MNRRQLELLGLGIGTAAFGLGLMVSRLPAHFLSWVGIALMSAVLLGLMATMWKQWGAIKQIVEDVEIMRVSNADHRVDGTGLSQLMTAINAYAESSQEQLTVHSDQMRVMSAAVEQERGWLTSLLSQMAEGVIVCNPAGRILLYNEQAELILAVEDAHRVGLNRPLGVVFEPAISEHILREIEHAHRQGNLSPLVRLIVVNERGGLVQVRCTSVVSQDNLFLGCILTLGDVTEPSSVIEDQRQLLDEMAGRLRPGLANIRAAIETLDGVAGLDEIDETALQQVIIEETHLLSAWLEAFATQATDLQARKWEAVDIWGEDLAQAIVRGAGDLSVGNVEPIWFRLDNFAVVQGMVTVVTGVEHKPVLTIFEQSRWGAVGLTWDAVGYLERLELAAVNLNEIAERYGGAVWCWEEEGQTFLRLLLPQADAPKDVFDQSFGMMPALYDFDLFDLADARLGETLLTKLTYTVFDTETTGLDPSGGDEIVSIAGFRIVNGRLIEADAFDRLVNPMRAIPRVATEIHGISAETVRDAPVIDVVIPEFARFSAETVLIGHNIAFDMRLLELKEAATGIKFDHPILDTLLLASALYPNRDDYSLEVLGNLLGIPIVDRHNAKGDALITGKIFLKLLPLLEDRGITTLSQAMEVAEQSFLSQLRY